MESGFTAITGETGAGKSLLLDALGLICGNRGQARLVGPDVDAASVVARFEVIEPEVWEWLTADYGVTVDDEIAFAGA